MIPSTEENDQPPAKVPTNANFRAKGSKGGYISDLRSKFDLNAPGIPSMTLKERKQRAERLNAYLMVSPPEQR